LTNTMRMLNDWLTYWNEW